MTSASAVMVSPMYTGAVNFQFWLRNTVPGPGMSIATSACSSPVVSPPCTTSRPNFVRAANAASKCSGLRSPEMFANWLTRSDVSVRLHEAHPDSDRHVNGSSGARHQHRYDRHAREEHLHEAGRARPHRRRGQGDPPRHHPHRVTLRLLDFDFPKAKEQLIVVREESAYRFHLQACRVRSDGTAVFASSADNQTFRSAKEHEIAVLGNDQ